MPFLHVFRFCIFMLWMWKWKFIYSYHEHDCLWFGWPQKTHVASSPRHAMKWLLLERKCHCLEAKPVLHCRGLKGCCPRKNPLLQNRHPRAWVKLQLTTWKKEKRFWRKDLLSDETKRYVWRSENGEVFIPKNTVHDAATIMLWCCFAPSWTWCFALSGRNNEERRLPHNSST